ncbi:hypothetical protein SUGI_1053180 [Cryptomeria japonica]|nr:hypothetical protein SUGI_1053180 [Cryptomeria japonica]
MALRCSSRVFRSEYECREGCGCSSFSSNGTKGNRRYQWNKKLAKVLSNDCTVSDGLDNANRKGFNRNVNQGVEGRVKEASIEERFGGGGSVGDRRNEKSRDNYQSITA